jgi:hypothetical protein
VILAKPTTKTEVLRTVRLEINKQYIEYDLLERIQKIYTAPSDAIGGTPCIVIEYIYYGTGNNVRGRKEGYDVWSDSFDGNPDFLTDDLFNILEDNLANQLVEM